MSRFVGLHSHTHPWLEDERLESVDRKRRLQTSAGTPITLSHPDEKCTPSKNITSSRIVRRQYDGTPRLRTKKRNEKNDAYY
jgi:hypothetical protein